MHVPLSSRREVSGAWNSQSWTLNTSDLKHWHNGQTYHKKSSTKLLVKTSFDKRKQILIILSSRRASVVRCAVPSWGEQCLKQPKFNNVRAIIVPREQNSWGTCGSLRQRLSSCAPTRFFCQILLPWWGERYVKKPKFNNARVIIVLAEQNSWATCGPLSQRFSRFSTWIFFFANFAAVVRWAVGEKAKVQQCTCHYCASPPKRWATYYQFAS